VRELAAAELAARRAVWDAWQQATRDIFTGAWYAASVQRAVFALHGGRWAETHDFRERAARLAVEQLFEASLFVLRRRAMRDRREMRTRQNFCDHLEKVTEARTTAKPTIVGPVGDKGPRRDLFAESSFAMASFASASPSTSAEVLIPMQATGEQRLKHLVRAQRTAWALRSANSSPLPPAARGLAASPAQRHTSVAPLPRTRAKSEAGHAQLSALDALRRDCSQQWSANQGRAGKPREEARLQPLAVLSPRGRDAGNGLPKRRPLSPLRKANKFRPK
jgi:hypothetical protein